MAALKRNRGTWILILLLATSFFVLRDRRGNASTNALPPLVINVPTLFSALDNGPNDSNPAVGIFEYCGDLTIGPAGSVSCDEVGTPASACDINMVILGNLIIQAGGSIHADNVGNNGGTGGDITLDIGGPNFTLCGPNSTTVACGNLPLPGAFISSQQAGGGNGQGGDILIRVGGVKTIPDPVCPTCPLIGVCDSPVICGVTIPANTGDALIENNATALFPAATIISDAASGRAGDIAVYTGHNITVNGVVHAQGFQGAGHGGAITLDACCNLTIGDNGLVTSEGRDPGPDRVHLEACVVVIDGLVQSTGPAHENPSPNCTPPDRPGKPTNSTACVEVWAGTTLTIDSTGTHHGQVNADVGMSGGSSGHGWVDLLANGNVVLNDGNGNDAVNPLVSGPQSPFLVHANMFLSGDGPLGDKGGDILVVSKSGTVSLGSAPFGQTLQANNTANGGEGGTITVEAFGVASLDSSFNEAKGGAGAGSAGGLIEIHSQTSGITGGPGGGLTATGGGPVGAINLRACIPITYNGPSNPAANLFNLACPVTAFPQPADTQAPAANCAQFCSPSTPTPTPTRTPTPQQLTRTPGNCPEDPNAVMTRTVDPSGTIHIGLPNHLTVQAAYNAAANSGETIGMFGNTVENVTLGGTKSMKITQCTSARITAAISAPVWDISSTGKLTIQGPDSVGGTIGWWVHNATGGPHTLKSIRANGASQYGVLIASNSNDVSWNDVSGNGPGAGVRVTGNSNKLKGGDASSNKGDGVQLAGNTNELSGATVESNTANGIVATGNSNKIKSNRVNLNTLDGLLNSAGSGNNYSGNTSNNGGKENGGAEFRFITTGVNGGSNKADGTNVPSAAKGCTSFNAGQACE